MSKGSVASFGPRGIDECLVRLVNQGIHHVNRAVFLAGRQILGISTAAPAVSAACKDKRIPKSELSHYPTPQWYSFSA
jgi:hypothetical protein